MRRAAAVCALLALAAAAPAAGASRVLPSLRFRVLETPHFRVYYHQREERLARELGTIAESVRTSLSARLRLPAPAMTHVLLVDQDDAANGWATPLPYDTVMVTAAWPGAGQLIGNTSDWLRLVFTHEYTHILQLKESRGWARIVRAVFGRSPLAFPNLFLPEWEVEGLATYEESRETGHGRLYGGDASAIVRERAREAGPERLGSVGGGQVDWPGSLAPYLYGGFFHQYLAERFGEAKLGELARRSAGRLPYLASPVFRVTFGRSLGDLWKDYQRSLTAEGRELARGARCEASEGAPGSTTDPGACRRLTWNGFYAATPRFADEGRSLVYSVRHPDGLPALVERAAGEERRLATRYGGEQLAVSGRLVYFDQADYEVNVAWRSDLYVLERSTGRVRRLTRGARLLAPDVSADGRLLVCLRVVDGRRQLAVFRVAGSRLDELRLTPAPLPRPEETGKGIFGSPRFSPDGRRIAAERRRPGGPSEIVVIDVETGDERVATSSSAGRSISPAWMPDGRTLLFASDRAGTLFQLYTVSVDGGDGVRELTSVPGGALSPEPSPDGSHVVYVGYSAGGYDLFELTPRHWGRESISDRDDSPRVPVTGERTVDPGFRDRAYDPLSTLLPRAWIPVVDTLDGNLRAGASTGGVDVLGRHAFDVSALWRLEGGGGAVDGPHRARPDWSAVYSYDRWRPTVFAAVSQETSFLPSAVGGLRVADAELLQTNASVGVALPFFRLPHAQTWLAAFNYERDSLTTIRGERRFGRNALRMAWAFDDAHEVGYSIGPEQGVRLAVTSEQVRSAFGADGNADALTGEARGYVRLGGPHAVLAARVGGGVSSGDANVARVFYLGGPGPASPLIDFGSSALSLLRGYDAKTLSGSRAAVANLEYRLPLWRIERGWGTWPLFLRTVHAAVFADAGQAWDRGFQWSRTVGSIGAEISLDVVAGFALPLTLSAGVASPWDAGRRDLGRPTGYVRAGRSF